MSRLFRNHKKNLSSFSKKKEIKVSERCNGSNLIDYLDYLLRYMDKLKELYPEEWKDKSRNLIDNEWAYQGIKKAIREYDENVEILNLISYKPFCINYEYFRTTITELSKIRTAFETTSLNIESFKESEEIKGIIDKLGILLVPLMMADSEICRNPIFKNIK
jgi:hypothetical protein